MKIKIELSGSLEIEIPDPPLELAGRYNERNTWEDEQISDLFDEARMLLRHFGYERKHSHLVALGKRLSFRRAR